MTISILPQSQTVSQFDLVRFTSLSAQIDSLKSEHAELERQLITAIGSGADVEPGNHTPNCEPLSAGMSLGKKW